MVASFGSIAVAATPPSTSAQISSSSAVSGYVLQTDGIHNNWVATSTLGFSGGSGTPGGLNLQVQYNNAGSFGGISGAVTNGTILNLTNPLIGGATITTSSVNGVTLTTGGATTSYLNASGAYSVPVGTTYTATYPVTLTSSAFGLAFGTTTANTWSALNIFNGNATTTALTVSGNTWLTNLGTPAGTFLAVDANGKIIATTTPSSGGSGTVTSITTNNGITGGTITTTGTIGLATINAGVLGSPVNGAVPTSQATSTLYGIGTNGFVLAEVSGIPTWTATTTLATISGTLSLTTQAAGTLQAAQFPALTGDITTSAGSLATSLKSTGTAGTYRSTTFDAQGRETSGTNPTTFAGYAISDTSANLAAALTDETGSGLAVFNASPTFTGLSTFANSSTTLGSFTYASSTGAFFGTLTIPTLATAAGAFLAVDANGKVIATTTPMSGSTFTSIGPAGALQIGPNVTLATSTTPFNGLTSSLTITGGGNTITFAPTLSGTLGIGGGGTGLASLNGDQILYTNHAGNGLLQTATSTLSIGGNAATATALAANPTNCSAGSYPLGIDASGNVENCTVVPSGVTTFSTTTAQSMATSSISTSDFNFANFKHIQVTVLASTTVTDSLYMTLSGSTALTYSWGGVDTTATPDGQNNLNGVRLVPTTLTPTQNQFAEINFLNTPSGIKQGTWQSSIIATSTGNTALGFSGGFSDKDLSSTITSIDFRLNGAGTPKIGKGTVITVSGY